MDRARGGRRSGLRQCVLTRGYGRRTSSPKRVVVSDGHRLMADAQRGGDEPRLLAENLLGIAAVIADADRIRAARWAMENLGSGAFLLDDGYQHRRLARTLDIAVIDATNPWSNYWTLPRGRLRESLSALKRADCVVITRSEQAEDFREDAQSCRATIAKRRPCDRFEQ
ncbi:MAG: tetraacyldisaccharide 4'-kinase [Pyrinomonadaceae bacterium]